MTQDQGLPAGITRWSAYSPSHKVELSSHAVWDGVRCLVFDPIPLPVGTPPLTCRPDRIVLTNENHERDAAAWRDRFGIEIWAAPEAQLELSGVRRWTSDPANSNDWSGWMRIALPGGAGGETAFFLPKQSLMVFGDAVVNLPGRRLELLPDRYCRDPSLLRVSLRRLPPFEQALFAHGDPLPAGAGQLIAALL